MEYYRLGNFKFKYKYNNISSACAWLLASPSSYAGNTFMGVSTGANSDTMMASSSRGLAPAFKV